MFKSYLGRDSVYMSIVWLKKGDRSSGLRRCLNQMSFNINNKLVFFDSFQFLSSSLDSLVKTLGKVDFMCFSQEFDGNVLDLVK